MSTPPSPLPPVPPPPAGKTPGKRRPLSPKAKRERQTEALNICGFALALASWGYSVIAPEPNIALGCTLLGLAVLLIFVAMCRMFQLKKFAKYIAAVVYFGIAFGFGYFVLFKPLRGKEFKTLLVAGYQIVSECQVIPANTQTPDWLHDQEERWRGKVTEAVDEKLDYRSAQLWHGAIVYGLVTDKDTNGYRCSQMAVSTDALEQIIAKKYDPSLPHKQYSGPVYQLHQPK